MPLLATALFLMGCAPQDDDFLARSCEPDCPDAEVPVDTSHDSGDTGTSTLAPTLSDEIAIWSETDEGAEWNILTTATVTDSDGDVLGGTFMMTLYIDDIETEVSDPDGNPPPWVIGETGLAWLEKNVLTCMIGPANTASTYRMDFYITDVAGNASNAVEVDSGPFAGLR